MKPVLERIMAKVVIQDTHWIWMGAWSKPHAAKLWQREQSHLWALNLPRDPTRHVVIQRDAIRPLIKLDGRNQNVRRILMKCDHPNQRVYPACYEPKCVNPEHARLVLAKNEKTGQRPPDPTIDENVRYIVEAYPDNPEEAASYGATAIQIAAARRILHDRRLQD
jgi:hypothetical protein